jgi:bifunctional DNase/RNase
VADGIALAVRTKARIFVSAEVFDEAGVSMPDDDHQEYTNPESPRQP